jgi:hypothetical protein
MHGHMNVKKKFDTMLVHSVVLEVIHMQRHTNVRDNWTSSKNSNGPKMATLNRSNGHNNGRNTRLTGASVAPI